MFHIIDIHHIFIIINMWDAFFNISNPVDILAYNPYKYSANISVVIICFLLIEVDIVSK